MNKDLAAMVEAHDNGNIRLTLDADTATLLVNCLMPGLEALTQTLKGAPQAKIARGVFGDDFTNGVILDMVRPITEITGAIAQTLGLTLCENCGKFHDAA